MTACDIMQAKEACYSLTAPPACSGPQACCMLQHLTTTTAGPVASNTSGEAVPCDTRHTTNCARLRQRTPLMWAQPGRPSSTTDSRATLEGSERWLSVTPAVPVAPSASRQQQRQTKHAMSDPLIRTWNEMQARRGTHACPVAPHWSVSPAGGMMVKRHAQHTVTRQAGCRKHLPVGV